ncbi:MAG: DUF885 domain-containing protein [Myxococcota bacterium]
MVATALYACATPSNPAASTPAPVKAVDPAAEAKKLDALLEEYFEANLKMSPIQATFIGDKRYNYLLPNFLSPSAMMASEVFEKHWLTRIEAEIERDVLQGQARLSYDVFVSQRKSAIEGMAFPGELQPITQFFSIPSFMAQLGSGQSVQPFKTVKDYEDWLLRLDAAAILFDQSIVNMKEGIKQKVVQPKIVVQKAIPQIAAHIVDDVEKSVFWMPIKSMPDSFSKADKKRLADAYRQRISAVIVPAYRRLHSYLKGPYLANARDTHGYWALPNGADWYAYQVKSMTTTDRTPEELHQLGLKEVARLHDEMRKVMKEVKFEGDLSAFFKYVNEDPQFYYTDANALLQGYRDLQSKVNKLLPKMFDVFPKADYEVREVEKFRAASSAGASYMPGSPDGSRKGVFYVNTYDLRRQAKFGMETLSIHEASPGHHFQISIQQEIESLPRFRRFGGYTAYAEGWALYAESIGKEMGMFDDPMQYYGMLDAQLFRAMRLVVDTGLHYKKWTREQAIEYMKTNSSMAESDIVAEVERYIVMPGQALAYKVGQIAIRQMRNRAEKALGSAFDVKAFHRAILTDGALPLDVLDTKIDEWISSQKMKKAS